MTDSKNKLVLVVDDEKNICDLLASILSGESYDFEVTQSPEEALEKIGQRMPDLIITDLMMSGSGGYGLLKKLQEQEAGAVPVIVMSARVVDPSTEQLIREEANVVAFIPKPFKIPDLLALLHRLLDLKHPAPPRKL